MEHASYALSTKSVKELMTCLRMVVDTIKYNKKALQELDSDTKRSLKDREAVRHQLKINLASITAWGKVLQGKIREAELRPFTSSSV